MARTSALPLRQLLRNVLLIALTYPRVFSSECYTYLAPSTIPGAGLGIFAGSKSYQVDEQVTFGDLVIPIYDLDWHQKRWSRRKFLWDEYAWGAGVFDGMEAEAMEIDEIYAASIGMGAAPNCLLPLVNLYDDAIQLDNAGLDSTSPGVGSFTPYHGRVYRASQDIEPGMELFVDYGITYFYTRQNIYGAMPFESDYPRANFLLLGYLQFKDYYSEGEDADRDDENDDTDSEAIVSDLWSVLQDFKSIWTESTVLMAVPEEESIVRDLIDNGGTKYTFYNRSIRDIAWLEEHGECMDNIRDGTSTIPHAGRGAFANRKLPKGSLVSPVPLLHIYDKEYLTTYETTDSSLTPNRTVPVHSQLMRNYCFGHPQSQLMLCPYGMLTASINHAHKKPNIKLEWSKSTSMRHPEWKEMPVDKWANELHAGLSFDYVALRDIEEGEEILLDYGAAWEKAWELHVRNYRTMREHYLPAFELNEIIDDNLQIRTRNERSYSTDSVYLLCRRKFAEWNGLQDSILKMKELPCRVLERREGEGDGETTYVAEVVYFPGDTDVCESAVGVGILWNVTRDAFYFEDMPYGRDHHQPWTFRHEMHIPDEMFPEIWKTTTTTTTTTKKP
jgi:hypothetical protein